MNNVKKAHKLLDTLQNHLDQVISIADLDVRFCIDGLKFCMYLEEPEVDQFTLLIYPVAGPLPKMIDEYIDIEDYFRLRGHIALLKHEVEEYCLNKFNNFINE
jgi:hypothetical protein